MGFLRRNWLPSTPIGRIQDRRGYYEFLPLFKAFKGEIRPDLSKALHGRIREHRALYLSFNLRSQCFLCHGPIARNTDQVLAESDAKLRQIVKIVINCEIVFVAVPRKVLPLRLWAWLIAGHGKRLRNKAVATNIEATQSRCRDGITTRSEYRDGISWVEKIRVLSSMDKGL